MGGGGGEPVFLRIFWSGVVGAIAIGGGGGVGNSRFS